MWTTIKNTFTNIGQKIGDSMSKVFKAAVNGLLQSAEKVLNSPVSAINKAIDVLNGIPGVSIGKLDKFSLPRMFRGGVLKKGQVGLLEGSGAEAVVPLEKNRQWIKRVTEELRKQLNVSGLLNELKSRVGGLLGGLSGNSMITNASNVSNGVTNNYNQVINAPKQPSRAEIYRYTKNLLELKGGA